MRDLCYKCIVKPCPCGLARCQSQNLCLRAKINKQLNKALLGFWQIVLFACVSKHLHMSRIGVCIGHTNVARTEWFCVELV